MPLARADAPMDSSLAFVGIISLVSLAWPLARLRNALHETSLGFVWPWGAATWLAWVAAALVEALAPLDSTAFDLIWYSVAILTMIPPIAVLGGRRATARVWSTFILLPLGLVFFWPVLAAIVRGGLLGAFRLEEPLLLGAALIVLMGTGNYLGMRFSLSALLWGAAIGAILLPLCPATAAYVSSPQTARMLATWFFIVAVWSADWLARRGRCAPRGASSATPSETAAANRVEIDRARLDRLWGDFRDLFGLVWSRRVLERFNERSCQEGHAIRLSMKGFDVASAAGSPECDVAAELAFAESALGWLLQKFVEPGWIGRRMGGGGEACPPAADRLEA
jgi:hypothetical protein